MKVRCNNCMTIFNEEKIVGYGTREGDEICPYCGKHNCMMDLPEMNKNLNTLELYKDLLKTHQAYQVAMKLFCYAAVDAFVNNPTDKEYEVIADRCIAAYMKADECDLGKLADIICRKYANKEFTLDELNEMSSWDILFMVY